MAKKPETARMLDKNTLPPVIREVPIGVMAQPGTRRVVVVVLEQRTNDPTMAAVMDMLLDMSRGVLPDFDDRVLRAEYSPSALSGGFDVMAKITETYGDIMGVLPIINGDVERYISSEGKGSSPLRLGNPGNGDVPTARLDESEFWADDPRVGAFMPSILRKV